MASPTRWTWIWVSSGSWWLEAWHAAGHGVTKHWTQLSDWTEMKDDLLSLVRSKKWILEQYFSELEESFYVTYVTWNWNSELSPKYLKPLETQILFGDLHNEESHYFRRSSLKFQRVPMDSFKNSYIHFKSALSTANFTA